jgi:VWFA-related protein
MRLTSALAATLVFAAAASPQTVFRGSARLVTVPVVVKDMGGKFVRDLRAEDFHIFDNGRPQRFEFGYIDEPVALAVVAQTTDSVRAWLPHVRRVASAVEALIVGANGEAAIIRFGAEVTLVRDWTKRTDLIDSAFASMVATIDDKSRCFDALLLAANSLAGLPPAFRRVILLISQPGDIGSSAGLAEALGVIERKNIVVYSLEMPRFGKELAKKTIRIGGVDGVFAGKDTGIMGSVDLGKLVTEIQRGSKAGALQDAPALLAAETGGSRTPFRRLRELESGMSSIAEELHTEYLLTYSPDMAEPGYHQIRVETSRPNVTARWRPGYYVAPSN